MHVVRDLIGTNYQSNNASIGIEDNQIFSLFSEYTTSKFSPTCTAEGYENPGFCLDQQDLFWRQASAHLVLVARFWRGVWIGICLYHANVLECPIALIVVDTLPSESKRESVQVGIVRARIGYEVPDLLG